jgi:hypothetical protein
MVDRRLLQALAGTVPLAGGEAEGTQVGETNPEGTGTLRGGCRAPETEVDHEQRNGGADGAATAHRFGCVVRQGIVRATTLTMSTGSRSNCAVQRSPSPSRHSGRVAAGSWPGWTGPTGRRTGLQLVELKTRARNAVLHVRRHRAVRSEDRRSGPRTGPSRSPAMRGLSTSSLGRGARMPHKVRLMGAEEIAAMSDAILAPSFAARSAGRTRLVRSRSAPSAFHRTRCSATYPGPSLSQPGEVGRRGLAAAIPLDRDASADCQHDHDPTAGTREEKATGRTRRAASGPMRRRPGTVVPKMNWSQARAVRRNAVSSSCPKAMALRRSRRKWTARKGPAQRGAVSVADIGTWRPPASPDGRDGNGQTLNRGDGRVLERAAQ